MTADSRSRRPTFVILVRDTRILGGTSLFDAGSELKTIANMDTRNRSGYGDFIGCRRVIGYAGWFNSGIRTKRRYPTTGTVVFETRARLLKGMVESRPRTLFAAGGGVASEAPPGHTCRHRRRSRQAEPLRPRDDGRRGIAAERLTSRSRPSRGCAPARRPGRDAPRSCPRHRGTARLP